MKDVMEGEPTTKKPGAFWRSREALVAMLLVVVGALAFIEIRLTHPVTAFGNNDVAGILYNADLIRHGALPYVDSQEFKGQGAAFLVAALWAVVGRDVVHVQQFIGAWLFLGAFAVFWAARELYGERAGIVSPALAMALYLLSAGLFEANYSSWMAPVYVLAFACALAGVRRKNLWLHVCAGLAAGFAFQLKQQAAVLGLVFPVIALWTAKHEKRFDGRMVVAWIVGGMASFVPLGVVYGSRGELATLIAGFFPLRSVVDYAHAAGVQLSPYELVSRIAVQRLDFFPAACSLSLLSVGAWLAAKVRRSATAPLLPALALVLAGVIAGGLGGARYYEHYLVQDLPAVALVGAHPQVLRRAADLFGRGGPRRALVVLLGLAVACAAFVRHASVVSGRWTEHYYLPPRTPDGRTENQEIGEYIRQRTSPEDRISVWGWYAWPVHYWADRRAPGRVYKHLGAVTTRTTHTKWAPSYEPFHFRPGPLADELIAAMRARPPAYFVYTPYFTFSCRCEHDPLMEFTQLHEILERDYVADAKIGAFLVLRRRDFKAR